MGTLKTKRMFDSLLVTGLVATLTCFLITLVYWPIYGTITKALITLSAGSTIAQVEPAMATKYITVFTEGVFFFTCISAWVWQVLIFGGYGKYTKTQMQPAAGFRYSLWSLILGIGAFLLLIGFIGIWWKPFSFPILFRPKNAEELMLAIEGWEAANFSCLAVLIAQIPFVSLLHKQPFTGKINPPWDGLGVMGISGTTAMIVWMAIFIPSFLKFELGGELMVGTPFGSWPGVLAFCQGFILWFLIPAEGGEHYPMKLFAKKQPWMGFVGLAIALVFGGFLTPLALSKVVEGLNILPAIPTGTKVASLELSIIVVMLTWHHLFDDYPTAEMVPSVGKRVITRVVIWVVLGLVYGFTWLHVFTKLPYGGNNMGLGYPTMGILAGQFAFLMVVLYMNAVFDKYPFVRKIQE